MTNPYQPTDVNVETPPQHDESIEDVRMGQRLVVIAFVMNIVVGGLGGVHPALPVVMALGALIVGVWGIVRLARGFGWGWGMIVLCLLLMIVPLVNLITLLALNSKATRRLREAGYRVGLLGASPAKS